MNRPLSARERLLSLHGLAREAEWDRLLKPITDRAVLLGLRVARGEMSFEAAHLMALTEPWARAVLAGVHGPECEEPHLIRAPYARPDRLWWEIAPTLHVAGCFCEAGTRVFRCLRDETEGFTRACGRLDRLIRKRLAPVLARRGTEAELAAVCRECDPAGILTPAWRRAIAEEEAAWWMRLHAATAEVRYAA